MPLTKLDAHAALIVIDLQQGIVSIPTVHPAKEIVGRTVQLAEAFRERSFPVVLVSVKPVPSGRTDAPPRNLSLPPEWTDLVPELRRQPEDILITKHHPGAFIGTSLDEHLRHAQVTQVFVSGISTSVGVESTIRSAFDHGYNVVAVVDAMTDRDADSHRHSVEKVFPRMCETGTTENVLKMLDEKLTAE